MTCVSFLRKFSIRFLAANCANDANGSLQNSWRRRKNEPVARLIHVESVAINQIVSVFLRQAAPQRLERLASVLGAVDHHAAIGGAALFVLSGGNKPRSVRIAGMDRDGKSEHGGLHIFDLGPRPSAVG